MDKPMSHLMVHGHESEKFIASISTISRIFKEAAIPREVKIRKRSTPYVSAHDLLDNGFYLVCYDGTQIDTDSGVPVWGIPVLLLPPRYLFHVGHSVGSISARDLTNAVDEAVLSMPKHIIDMLVAHSDRGSAMKANFTKEHLHKTLGIPVHFGRPHTPDDEAWIEALIKTMKYHRDCPSHFSQVDDVLQWFKKFTDIYNNDPHSSLEYVTPLQVLSGEMEEILAQRKQNYLDARNKRLYNYHVSKLLLCKQGQEVACLST
jgi:transposase InsO family protein